MLAAISYDVNRMKRALITGIAGQDGSYLAELLLTKGYEVFGLMKKETNARYVPKGAHVLLGDLTDHDALRAAVSASKPDEVYNFAGIADMKTILANPELTKRVNDPKNAQVLLDACMQTNDAVRFLQASSSEIFLPSENPLNETSPRDWENQNPYTHAKLLTDRDVIQELRKKRGVFCCSAFLFGHESPRRSDRSVLRKICQTLVKIHLGLEAKLSIGNVETKRDWGFAGDYVDAMWRMLQRDAPEDYVIATGQLHRVQDAIDIAVSYLNIHDLVAEIVPEFYRPTEQCPKVGDIRKAEKILTWKPMTDFKTLIEMMVQAELEAIQKTPT